MYIRIDIVVVHRRFMVGHSSNIICLSIKCLVCGEVMSNNTRWGFTAFQRVHNMNCGAESFIVSESFWYVGDEE